MSRGILISITALALLTVLQQIAFGCGVLNIHLNGYGYETGGFEFSEAGDELVILALVTSIQGDAVDLPYRPDDFEYTVVLDDLISQGEVDEGGGFSSISYLGGTIAIYQDANFNADFSTPHIVGFPPPTFTDGDLWAGAPLDDFQIVLHREASQGGIDALLIYQDGLASSWLNCPSELGAGLIPGQVTIQDTSYGLSFDGETWTVIFVPTQSSTLSKIKAIY